MKHSHRNGYQTSCHIKHPQRLNNETISTTESRHHIQHTCTLTDCFVAHPVHASLVFLCPAGETCYSCPAGKGMRYCACQRITPKRSRVCTCSAVNG
jgi:hypothetical protein